MGAFASVCCQETQQNKQRLPRPVQSPVQNSETRVCHIRKSTSDPLPLDTPLFNLTITPKKNSLQEPEEEQFYDIEQFIEERQKSKMQPQKMASSHFQVLGLLGKGAFCNVFLVTLKQEQPEDEGSLPLAMKKIPKSKLSSQKTKESIKLERHILATSCSPFITNLKYAFLDKLYLYIVMQFAEGGDASRLLKPRIRQQFLKNGEDSVKFIVASVVLALEYLHSEGIIYRDLKPQNILLFANGYVKLSDFGLAKLLPDKDQRAKTLAGTAVYCSPEMILQVGYNKAVDFWALGILIYELTTGETPFKLEDVSSKLRFKRIAIQEETNRKWRGHRLSAATSQIVGSLLRFNPQDRLGMKGWEQIKKHRYFFGFNWEQLVTCTLPSPLTQLIKNNPKKVKQFREVPETCQTDSEDRISEEQEQWNFNNIKTR